MKVIVEKSWLPSRVMTQDPTTVVLHATAGGTAASSVSWLRKIGLSYHYIIDRDGTIYKLVPTSRQAYHAGRSEGPSGTSCNRYSFGIAFANRNNGETVTAEQVQAAVWLLGDLKRAHPTLEYLTTHRLVSPGRKTDPKGFDPRYLANITGLKAWRPSEKHSWV